MRRRVLTPSGDPDQPMPAGREARRDAAAVAISSLQHERRRLERLGFELPLALCHEQLRFWNFVAGVLSLPAAREARPFPGGTGCPVARDR